MSKSTLSIDAAVLERARRYARRHGVSVSGLVEVYLHSLAEVDPPVLRSLRGVLRRGSREDYRKHLQEKHL